MVLSLPVSLAFSGQHRRRRWGAVLAGVGIAAVVFALYVRTLAPTVLGFKPPGVFDSAMLQAGVYVLGIGHPTGYPTYMMLTHLFTYLPVGDVGYRVNLASAVYGVAAVVVVYAVGLRLSGRVVAAAASALAFGVSETYWSQATIAEVYTLNVLFISLIVLVLLLWRDGAKDRYLLLGAFLAGLSLTHHLTSALVILAGVAFVLLTDRRKISAKTTLPKAAGVFVLGLAPYLYLPLRAAMEAPLNEADPSNLERFLLLITGSSFFLKNLTDAKTGGGAPGSGELSTGAQPVLDNLLTRLGPYAEHLSEQFPIVLVLAGILGAVYMASTDRAATVLLGVPFLGSLLHGLVYGYEDYYLFLIPAYVVFSLWIAAGLGVLLRGAETWTQRAPGGAFLLAVLVLALPFIGVRSTYAEEDRSRDYEGRREIEAVARNVEPGATVLHHRSSLWYMVLVEGRRRDLTLIDPFETSWVRYNDIVWPDPLDASQSAARYKTDDVTGVQTAREAAEKGPVYVLDPESADASRLREAGFDLVRVGENARLYELIPTVP
jgi:4-amino-4-deoxy-L-arabinose transferase-like glycosyltransferase